MMQKIPRLNGKDYYAMTVLLTGAAGYIGSHAAVELLRAGYDAVVADDLSNSSAKALDRVQQITGRSLRFYNIDVADKDALRRVFAENDIEAVMHFAGFKAVGESVAKPLMYYRNNLDTTLTLLECMEEADCRRIIFSSSAPVYGDPATLPITEDFPVGACTNPYGRTKYMIENILRDWTVAKPEASVVLLRYFNPVGAHPSGLIGEAPNGIPNNLMPFITQVALGKREKLSVFGSDWPTPDGSGVRDYIHVVDLAKGHIAALRYAMEHSGTEVFNLGTGNGYSVLQLVESFARVNEVPVPYVITERRPGDIASCYTDPSKARELLGWEAALGLDDMCRDSWNWQKNNPNGYE